MQRNGLLGSTKDSSNLLEMNSRNLVDTYSALLNSCSCISCHVLIKVVSFHLSCRSLHPECSTISLVWPASRWPVEAKTERTVGICRMITNMLYKHIPKRHWDGFKVQSGLECDQLSACKHDPMTGVCSTSIKCMGKKNSIEQQHVSQHVMASLHLECQHKTREPRTELGKHSLLMHSVVGWRDFHWNHLKSLTRHSPPVAPAAKTCPRVTRHKTGERGVFTPRSG